MNYLLGVDGLIALVVGVFLVKRVLLPNTLRIRPRAAIAERALELACNAVFDNTEAFVLTERTFFFNRERERSTEILCSAAGLFTDQHDQFFPVRARIAVGGNDANCMVFPARITVWVNLGTRYLKGCYTYLPLKDLLEPDGKNAENDPPLKIRF